MENKKGKEQKMYTEDELTFLADKLLAHRFSRSDVKLIAQDVAAEVKKDLCDTLMSKVQCLKAQEELKKPIRRLTLVAWAGAFMGAQALGIKVWQLLENWIGKV